MAASHTVFGVASGIRVQTWLRQPNKNNAVAGQEISGFHIPPQRYLTTCSRDIQLVK